MRGAAAMRFTHVFGLATLLLALALAAPGCAGGGGGGGGGAAASASSGVPRLLAVRRDALSPSASPAVLLIAEKGFGAASSTVALEESDDGFVYRAVTVPPLTASARAVLYELPLPPARRWYRVVGPAPSNEVSLDPFAPIDPMELDAPAGGSLGHTPSPLLRTKGYATAESYLFFIADATGRIVWLAESGAVEAQPGLPVARLLVDDGALPRGARYLASALALRGGVAFARTPRAMFETAP